MNKDILNSITVLSKKIKYHDQKYHEQDNPEITDIDYDEICKKYDQLIQQHPEFIYLERKLIGSSPSIQFDKYTHQKPMRSLVNGFTIKDIEDFINRTNKFLSLKNNMPLEIMCEPKIDGLSISLSYHNGILLNGVTRGDGTTGEIVTNNIKTISDIPHKLKKEYPEFIEVRGEIFMNKKSFNILNSTQEAKGKNIFANPRNAAAGSIRQKDIKILNERKLNFNADNAIFPHIKSNNWSQDNFGPIYIPKAGVTVKLDLTSLPYYKQIIQNYENNTAKYLNARCSQNK